MGLNVGSKAPEFTLLDTERKERSLKEFLGKKTILLFFPGAFTAPCTKELCTFRDSSTTLQGVDAQVVGISVDSPFANKAFAEQNRLGFPLLSDHGRTVSKQYAGVYEDFAGVKGYSAAKRAVYVLDKDGTVRYVWVTEQPGVEPPYEEVKQKVASL